MRKIKQTRRANALRLLEDVWGGRRAAMASALGMRPGYLSNILNSDAADSRLIGDEVAVRIEEAAGVPPDWLDVDRSIAGPPAGWSVPCAGRVLAATSHGAAQLFPHCVELDAAFGSIEELGVGAFTVRVETDDMAPRARYGEALIVDPLGHVNAGDEVFLSLRDGPMVIARLSSRHDGYLEVADTIRACF